MLAWCRLLATSSLLLAAPCAEEHPDMGISFHTLLLTPKYELMSLSTLLGYFPALQALLCCARKADTCASDRYLCVFLDVPYQC